jgi:predicted ATPase
LYRDDIFTNKIGELFFNYVSEVKNAKAKIGDDVLAGKNTDTSKFKSLPKAPWLVLNELFKDLGFDYRFKDHYERNDADQINEQPTIYAVAESGKIDENEKRSLQDLSDGEKAIISLTFAVVASDQVNPKILVLDEYDAPLNPSLTKAFFTVLERFFIAKGIQVIISTHSSATLSLAPDYARFYEVNKKKQNRPRILEVSREDYEEMRIANERFYKALEEKENNIKNLESLIQADKCLQIIT